MPFSSFLGMSYLGVTFIFGIFGYFGIVFFASALRQVATKKSRWVNKLVLIIPFLPGLHFWTAAIGKDSLIFFGVGLTCWATLDIKRRIFLLLLAVAVVFISRPHIAGILVISIAFGIIFFGRINIAQRAIFLFTLVPVCLFLVFFAVEYAGADGLSTNAELNNYVETRQGYNTEGGSSVDISKMNPYTRLLTYLFRPLFFDAGSILGLVASFENLVLIIFAITLLYRMVVKKMSFPSPEMVIFFIYFAITLVILANTTSNLGIALRQKWMIVPMLIIIAIYLRRNIRPSDDEISLKKPAPQSARWLCQSMI